jgi:hypothetical protein
LPFGCIDAGILRSKPLRAGLRLPTCKDEQETSCDRDFVRQDQQGALVSLIELSSVLWRTRELMELLLFKLEEEQVLLASGRSRWLAHATREVEMVLEQMRETEVIRAAHAQAAAVELGLSAEASLGEIADAAAMPWSDLLHEHRKSFLTLTAEISGLAATNRDLLSAGQRAARETMMIIAGSVETYGPKGQSVSAGHRARLVDEAI